MHFVVNVVGPDQVRMDRQQHKLCRHGRRVTRCVWHRGAFTISPHVNVKELSGRAVDVLTRDGLVKYVVKRSTTSDL